MSGIIGTCVWCERRGPLKRHKTNKGVIKMVCEAFDGARNTCRPEDVDQDSMDNMGNMVSMGSTGNMSMMDIDLSDSLTKIEKEMSEDKKEMRENKYIFKDRLTRIESSLTKIEDRLTMIEQEIQNNHRIRSRSPRYVPPPRR